MHLKDRDVLASSVDPDQTALLEPSDLGQCCFAQISTGPHVQTS